MKITLRLDQLDTHAHVAVFVNGGNSGELCLASDDWHEFRQLVASGAMNRGHAYKLDDARKEWIERRGR